MISRTAIPFAIAAALTLAACGGDSESSVAPSDSLPAEGGSDTTIEAPVESELPTETTAPAVDDASGAGCEQVLAAAEIDSILGTSVEINGSGQVCQYVFASDSVGTLQAFDGSKADEAMDTLLPKFLADETAVARGVVLADDRGYVDEHGAVVRGDSGRVFSLGIPANIGVADMLTAMQEIADLLLTR